MGKVICLMGKSSTGKDTILKLLKEDIELELKMIITYTTRPIRSNENNGIEYFFIDDKILKEFEADGKVIEKRGYNTVAGIWNYCTIDDGQIQLDKGNHILITTLEAYKKIQNYFEPENVVPIYVAVDDGIRLERAIIREKQQLSPNYDELCRRFLADTVDFSVEKLEELQIIKYYDNYHLNECYHHIKKDLMKII